MSTTCALPPIEVDSAPCCSTSGILETRLDWIAERASRLRTDLGKDLTSAVLDAERVTAALGTPVEIVFDRLAREAGREDALLIPLSRTGGFRIVVDPVSVGATSNQVESHQLARLVAHELGHAQFFSPGRPPRRRVPWNPSEEYLCETFAECLLGRKTQQLTRW